MKSSPRLALVPCVLYLLALEAMFVGVVAEQELVPVKAGGFHFMIGTDDIGLVLYIVAVGVLARTTLGTVVRSRIGPVAAATLGVLLLTAVLSPLRVVSLKWVFRYALVLAALVSTYAFVANGPKERKIVLVGILAWVSQIALSGVWADEVTGHMWLRSLDHFRLGPGYGRPGRVEGFLINPNLYGGLMVVGASLWFAFGRNLRLRPALTTGGVLLCLYGVAASVSRNAWFSVLAVAAFLLTRAGWRKASLPVRVVSVVLVAVLIFSLLMVLVHKWAQIDRLIGPRMDLWQTAWNMWLSSPLVGWGPGTYPELFPRFLPADAYPFLPGRRGFLHTHNIFLQVLSELGLAGAVLIPAWLWALLPQIATPRDLRWLPLFSALVVSLGDNFSRFYPFTVLVALTCAAILGWRVDREENASARRRWAADSPCGL